MEHGQIILKQEQRLRLLSALVRFFLAAALTAAQTPGDHAPFALGCIAASGAGVEGVAALAGSVLGAVLFMDFDAALPFLAVGILILTAGRAVRLADRRRALSLMTAGLFLSVGGIYAAQSLSPAEDAAACLAAAVLAGISAWYYQPLLRPGKERLEPESLLALGVSLLLTLTDVTLGELSLGRGLLCLLLLYAACSKGAAYGAAAGLAAGLTVDLCIGSGNLLFAAGYGFAGFLAGRREGQRARAALRWLGAVFLVLLPVRHPLALPFILEAAFGAGIFLMLPSRLFDGKRVLRAEKSEDGGRDHLRQQLNRTAAALRELYDSMSRSEPQSTEENPAIVFDRAAEKVCRGCALCEICWQRDYNSTFNALNDATPYLLERGRAVARDLPSYFADRCIHLQDLLAAINGELSAFLLRRQYRRQLEETRRSAKGQYAQLSDLLTATAAGLGEAVRADSELPVCRIGAALRPKAGEAVCGDTLVSFQRPDGQWCLLLADGMGSGEAARKESALTCRLLRQFLEAGIEPEAALKTLNSAMALRGADTGSFTTVDLVTCRLETGETVFYKFGAAPSYVKKGGTVRRITGGTLPVGLRGAPSAPDVTRVTLAAGSFVVMVSDGVADPGRDDWLQNLLAGWEGEDPQTLAGLILRESVSREGLQDDCGIQVLYLPKTSGIKEV